MAESRDAAVIAQRAALAETRRRITSTLDAIDGRLRPPVKQLATGVAMARRTSGALTLIATSVATARQATGLVRTVRSLSRGQLALVVGGLAGAVGVVAWLSHERVNAGR